MILEYVRIVVPHAPTHFRVIDAADAHPVEHLAGLAEGAGEHVPDDGEDGGGGHSCVLSFIFLCCVNRSPLVESGVAMICESTRNELV